MNLSEPFIRRPVATTLVSIAIVAFGVVAYRTLPVSDLPNVDFPVIQVSAQLPGASPETMASAVATPLERQFSTIQGLQSMTSTNSLGSTSIALQFVLERNIDAAAQDVQAAIAAALPRLPPMPTPPSYEKVNPADMPILYIALTSKELPLYTLDEYAETRLAEEISTVSGVAQVLVYGSQKYAVRIEVNPQALSSRGIGLDQVQQAVASANVNLPTGLLSGNHVSYTVDANGQLTRAAQYDPIIVGTSNGAPVRLGDVAQTEDSVENDQVAAWYVNQRAVVLAIQRQPGTNTVAVAAAVKHLLPSFSKVLPASVSLHVLYDRSTSIKASVDDVKVTLLITLFLVVAVIFVFLRTLRATIIPSLALPMSVVGTFVAMWLLGYSMDNLSMMALTLSVGFVVDDAVVMLENIVRHMEMGEPVLEAALKGSKEIGFTIISMTLSLTAVFIPVLFMGGIVGRLFREFAVTIAVAILISGFISLTLTPMLSSRFLRPFHHEDDNWLKRLAERAFDGLRDLYGSSLAVVLRHRVITMLISVGILVAAGYLFTKIPKGFLPSEDAGQIFCQTEAKQGISFDAMKKHQMEAMRIIAKDPNVKEFMSSVGAMPGRPSNTGMLFMHLKPLGTRLPVDQVIAELRKKLAVVPGMRFFLQNPPPIRIGGKLTKAEYQYQLQGPETTSLYADSLKLEAAMRKIPGLIDVSSDLELTNPEIDVEVDRDRASLLGVTLEQVEDALYTAYGTRQVSTIYAPENEYEVIMELSPQYRRRPSALNVLYVRSNTGQLIPLSAVAKLTHTVGPLTVNHAGQLPAVTLSFDLVPGTSLSTATAAVERAARRILPTTITGSFQGNAQAFASSLGDLGTLLALAVLVIYLVLGILYESYLHPITILSALPFAGFGALLTLWLFHTELSLYAFVGLIMLVGLVKKNGIMMVDFAIEQRHAGKGPRDAIHEAALIRFRPILMTTFAALMGALPIALASGAGAESRRPLGLAVVGGLLFSQLLTLYVTPVFYTYMEGLSTRIAAARARRAAKHHPPQPPETGPATTPG